MASKLSIGIVGGSIAGCSAAILMSRAGHEVTVFERSIGALVGRGGGIGTSTPVLEALIQQDILDTDFPNCLATEMPFTARTNADRYAGRTPWAMPMDLRAFHWSTLWNNLRKRVPDERYLTGQTVVDVKPVDDQAVLLTTEKGVEEHFDLVLFADGYASIGRKLLFPDIDLSYRGYMLWRGLLPEHEMSESNLLGTTVPRLSYADMPGHMVIYFIPNEDGSSEAGKRIFNWAAYIPLPADKLDQFMVDRDGRPRQGTIPPGKVRIEEENRLKELMQDQLPSYYGEIVGKTQNTYVQLIYNIGLPAYYKNRMCLIGDAGMVVQPFTASGVFKGYNNANDLLEALANADTIDTALQQWSDAQVQTGNRLLVLAEQMEQAFIWNSLDFATADEATTAAWWKASVTFPEDFSYEAKQE